MIMSLILSFIIGIIPHCLFNYLAVKAIKKDLSKFYFLYSFLAIMVSTVYAFNLRIYILTFALSIISIKFSSKKFHWIDITMILLIYFVWFLTGVFCYTFFSSYYIAFINFLILNFTLLKIFSNKFLKAYNYCVLRWNKTKLRGLKSITIRNISIVIINLVIITTNLFLIYTINEIQKGWW